MIRRSRAAIGALLLCACSDPVRVLVLVEDPDALATGADRLTFSSNEAQVFAERALEGRSFPVSLSLASSTAGTRSLRVEAVSGERVLARAAAAVEFDGSAQRVSLALARACTQASECDDGIWCNGAESCALGLCVAGAPACGEGASTCFALACDEASRSCEVSLGDYEASVDNPCTIAVCERGGTVERTNPRMEGQRCRWLRPAGAIEGTCQAGVCGTHCPEDVRQSDPCGEARCPGEAPTPAVDSGAACAVSGNESVREQDCECRRSRGTLCLVEIAVGETCPAESLKSPPAIECTCASTPSSSNGVCRVGACLRDDWTPLAVDASGAPVSVGHVAASSEGGRFIVFTSAAHDVLDGLPGGRLQAFRLDRSTLRTDLVSVASDGVPFVADVAFPSVSADGDTVVFASKDPLARGASPDGDQVYVRHMRSGLTGLLSQQLTGPAVDCKDGPVLPEVEPRTAISADGRFVVFAHSSDCLVPGDINGAPDIFLHDFYTSTRTLISLQPNGSPLPHGAMQPKITDSGDEVFFVERTVAGAPGILRSYVISTGAATVVLPAEVPGNVLDYSISSSGDRVAFISPDTRLTELGSGHPILADELPDAFHFNRDSRALLIISAVPRKPGQLCLLAPQFDCATSMATSVSLSPDGLSAAYARPRPSLSGTPSDYFDVVLLDVSLPTLARYFTAAPFLASEFHQAIRAEPMVLGSTAVNEALMPGRGQLILRVTTTNFRDVLFVNGPYVRL